MASPPLSNDFDGGTDTNTITTGDTGSGDQWNTVNGSPTYSSDHYFDALSMEIAMGGTWTQTATRWTGLGSLTSSVYSRMYLWVDSIPSITFSPMQFRASGGGPCAQVVINNGGKFATLSAAAAEIDVGAITVPTGEWVRIEFHVVPNTSTGTAELKWYSSVSPGDGYDGTTPTETLSSVSSEALGANIDEVRYGTTSTQGPTSYTFWVDDCAVATSGWIGAASHGAGPVAPTLRIVQSSQRW